MRECGNAEMSRTLARFGGAGGALAMDHLSDGERQNSGDAVRE